MTSATLIPPLDRDQADLARESHRHLAHVQAAKVRTLKLVVDDNAQETVLLPAPLFRLILAVLSHVAHGKALTLLPVQAELTTQQAADLLGVSRPYLVKLLERGELPCRKVGRHRRVGFRDLVAYRKAMGERRKESLDELARLSEELGLYE